MTRPRTQQHSTHWTPAWTAVVGVLACVAVVLAARAKVLPVAWWAVPVVAIFGAVMTALVTFGQEMHAPVVLPGWMRVHLHRSVAWLAAGGWSTWVILAGWVQPALLSLAAGVMVLTGLSYLCRPPKAEPGAAAATGGFDRRPESVRRWEGLLRHLTKAAVTVTAVVPWDNPGDGTRVHVELPVGAEVTADRINDIKQLVAQALRLPTGCTVRVLDGDHQGAVVLDIMLRDCLADEVMVAEDFTPASVYDEFEVATTPRGEPLAVCLRSQSMVIGGAPDSGKTTLLHRIILFLARCVDALVWVVDTNGGGVATPWVRPWALGRAGRPIVDWVAADEDEAAVLVAVAAAIAKDRKTSPEATRRRHDADNNVLPVDAGLPAIVVLNDEGGEIRQAVSLLGQLADQGISRLAQIGRAEGVRAIKSVLRGTSDLLDKSLRVCAGPRICLRMEEEGEYVHVLGTEPGRTALLHKGTGYVRRPGDARPIFARTVNVALSGIERAAIACADLRPDLDERAQRVAAKIRVVDVLGGREPAPEIAALPVMRDVEGGRAYVGRWDRFAGRLAAMRGEELPESDDDQRVTSPSVANAPTAARTSTDPALAALLDAAGLAPTQPPAAGTDTRVAATRVDLDDQASVDRAAREILAGLDWDPAELTEPQPAGTPTTIREHVLAILNEAYPQGLTPAQIMLRLQDRGASANRTYLQDGVLKRMRESGEVIAASGTYTVPPK